MSLTHPLLLTLMVSGWGRCKYIRTLPSINVDEENRYGAEHWIR